ncbi:DUF4157 domain-containing protein [Anabaena azotica FACHB-119]|uniref:DUF4157 domain-containing protein n=2 Tax=Anabaena azotica TaxID=197653 RepID=A0ABR8CZU5_9NOST|nr:DUF4157 domain-containing protein [Anabaena azotica FACHB-119]
MSWIEKLHTKSQANLTTPGVQKQQTPQEEELQMKSADDSSWLQRQAAPEEELQMKPMVQRRPGVDGMAATSDLETSIQQSRGGGQPLADEIKQLMEQAFGADFGGVRIHTDAQSDKLNQSIQARAFTTGQDIFFRQGEYSPGSNTGKELLAHELTHVVQQNGSAVQRKTNPSADIVKQVSEPPNIEEVSTPSADIGIQRLCHECEQEQQQLSTTQPPEERLQAKEIAGYTININPDLPSLSNPSLQTKQQVTGESQEQETAKEQFALQVLVNSPGGEPSPTSAEGTEPPPDSPQQPEARENALVNQGQAVKSQTPKSTKSVEIATPQNKSPVKSTDDKAAEEQGKGLENTPASQALEQSPQQNPEEIGKTASPDQDGKTENIPASQALEQVVGSNVVMSDPLTRKQLAQIRMVKLLRDKVKG